MPKPDHRRKEFRVDEPGRSRDVARQYVEPVPTEEGLVFYALGVPGGRCVMCNDDPTEVVASILEADRRER